MESLIPTLFSFFSSRLSIADIAYLVTLCQSVNCMSGVFDFRDAQTLKH